MHKRGFGVHDRGIVWRWVGKGKEYASDGYCYNADHRKACLILVSVSCSDLTDGRSHWSEHKIGVSSYYFFQSSEKL